MLNRRGFLKLAGAAAAGTALPPTLSALAKPFTPPDEEVVRVPFVDFKPARVLAGSVGVYDSLDPGERRLIRTVGRDHTIDVAGEFVGPGPERNQTWYQTRDGYVYSAWLQIMEPYRTPQVYTDVGEWGIWIETIVPAAPAYSEPSENARLDYAYNYGTTYHVTETHVDSSGQVWYNTFDEYLSKVDNIQPTNHWAPAIFFRKIDEHVFNAINAHTPDKRIEIDLGKQLLTCYEGDNAVLSSRVASGASFKINDEEVDFSTPQGEFSAILKMPSRHMRAPEAERDTNAWFDLPGVPWNTFFTYDGIAIHGTYWHNDFGVPRSHGCVNVPIRVAKFVYFWTNPVAPYNDDFVQGDVPEVKATPIIVT
jgi:lipoprotein-anchoring transpeptidase ErfK/SrfK